MVWTASARYYLLFYFSLLYIHPNAPYTFMTPISHIYIMALVYPV